MKPNQIFFQLFSFKLFDQAKNFDQTLSEMKVKRSVKAIPEDLKDNKVTNNSPRTIVEMFNKMVISLETFDEDPTTNELEEITKNIDDIEDEVTADPTTVTQHFDTIGNLKVSEVNGSDGDSAQVQSLSLPVMVFPSTEFNDLSVSSG